MKKLLSLTALLLMTVSSFAHDFAVKNSDDVTIYYNKTADNEVAVTYQGTKRPSSSSPGIYSGEVNIPGSIEYNNVKYAVTSIGDYAFYYCTGLTSVTIPTGVTTIGSHAFFACRALVSVTIPEGVVFIGERAFRSCSALTEIRIPSTVTSMGLYAFNSCVGLTKIIIPDIVKWCNIKLPKDANIPYLVNSYRSPIQFAKHIYNDEGVEITDIVIPEGVTSINDFAFFGASYIKSVSIPSTVKYIGDAAFCGCENLEIINIPEGMSAINDFTFAGCKNLNEITFPTSVKQIGQYAFIDCRKLTEINLKEGLTQLGFGAFSNCSGLTSIQIPASLTDIAEGSFSSIDIAWKEEYNVPCKLISIKVNEGNLVYDSRDNCNAIIETSTNTLISGCNNTIIPHNVTNIGESAFFGCKDMTSITIPSNVTSIGSNAFSGCSGLQKVVASDIVAWCSINFNNITANPLYNAHHLYNGNNSEITNLFIPDGVTSIRNSAFSGCTGLTSVTIPNGVTTIGDNAFADCENLTDIELPKTLLSIGSYAFKNCKSFTKIEIPEGVSAIPEMAFSGCINVKNIKIPSGVKSIGNYAFSSCWSLTEIVIPEGVKTIGNSVFVGSRHDPETREPISGLQIITLPSTLESMGLQALGYLAFLKTLHSYIKEPFNANYVFDEASSGMYGNNATLYIPKGTKDKYLATNGWKIFANIVEMSPEIEPIEEETVIAFNDKDYIVDDTPVDLNNTVINDMYISMDNKSDVNNPDGFYDSNENCIVINKATSASAIATAIASDLGSSDFINNYTGIVIEVNGKGSVKINTQTAGNNKLAVKIGSDDVRTYTQVTKGDVTINYDVTENTYIYIYAVDANNQQQSLSMDITETSDNAVKVYSVTVTPDATAIETVTEADIPAAVFGKVYSIEGKQLSQPQKGLNILRMSDGTTRKVVK